MKKIILAVFILLFVFACSNDLANVKTPTRRATPQGTTATAQGVR